MAGIEEMKVAKTDMLEEKEKRTRERIAELDERVFVSWAKRREACIDIGYALIELKETLPHGEWLDHFEEVFAPLGLKLRTAERYMRRAQRARAQTKIDHVSDFKSASDEGADEIRVTTKRSQAEVVEAAAEGEEPEAEEVERNEKKSEEQKEKTDSRHMYRLALRVTTAERDATDALVKSQSWPRAERRILRCVMKLVVRYGIAMDGGNRA